MVAVSTVSDGNMLVSAGIEGKSNRQTFVEKHFWPGAQIFPLKPKHENLIAYVNGFPPVPLLGHDGVFTDAPGSVIGIPFFDCSPAVFGGSTPNGQPFTAGAHVGFKPLLCGIIPEIIRCLAKKEISLQETEVYVGPGICRDCYEFGPEAPETFSNYPEHVRWSEEKKKYLVGLRGIALGHLQQTKIPMENIKFSEMCTFESHHLFSDRRARKEGRLTKQGCMVFAGIRP
jgi:copper oxidase (laccase) domain-containing protein